MPGKVLEIYRDARGREPFIDWYKAIRDIRTQARIRNRVEAGNLGDCKPVGQGVTELRLDFGPGYRCILRSWLIGLFCLRQAINPPSSTI